MKSMGDLRNSRVIYFKGILFLVGGILSGGLLLLESPSVKTLVLLAVCIWCFARCYYFVFYVIEHYVDGEYRFAGVLHFLRYWISKKHASESSTPSVPNPDEPDDT